MTSIDGIRFVAYEHYLHHVLQIYFYEVLGGQRALENDLKPISHMCRTKWHPSLVCYCKNRRSPSHVIWVEVFHCADSDVMCVRREEMYTKMCVEIWSFDTTAHIYKSTPSMPNQRIICETFPICIVPSGPHME